MQDKSFQVDVDSLLDAVRALDPQTMPVPALDCEVLPTALPRKGIGEGQVLRSFASTILSGARYLDDPLWFAHMDPPTPWVTWVLSLWNARLNQNLLHPLTAPVARDYEQAVIRWLVPFFGMDGGHMVPGSTVANLTAIWAAREIKGVKEVVAPDTAHVSIEKATRLLGLRFRKLPTDPFGRLLPNIDVNLQNTCLVLVAGSTSTGVIDPLHLAGTAAWTHVDAAWAGPLRMSRRHAGLLAGIERADSVAVSAHKWLFQPKESALVFFRDTANAHEALSFGGAYLAVPNIGLLGSHGATAVPLLALLWAWGLEGLETRLDRCMSFAERFASFVSHEPRLELLLPPETGVVVWRSRYKSLGEMMKMLPVGLTSQAVIQNEQWLRCVAANPVAEIDEIIEAVRNAL